MRFDRKKTNCVTVPLDISAAQLNHQCLIPVRGGKIKMQLKQLPILFAQIDCSDDRPDCDCTEAEYPYIEVGEDRRR